MKIKNQALKDKAKEMNINESIIACYERIGMILYSKYGKSCYDYHTSGSPVDVQYIENAIINARKANMGCDTNIYDTNAWATILIEFWDKYPNY